MAKKQKIIIIAGLAFVVIATGIIYYYRSNLIQKAASIVPIIQPVIKPVTTPIRTPTVTITGMSYSPAPTAYSNGTSNGTYKICNIDEALPPNVETTAQTKFKSLDSELSSKISSTTDAILNLTAEEKMVLENPSDLRYNTIAQSVAQRAINQIITGTLQDWGKQYVDYYIYNIFPSFGHDKKKDYARSHTTSESDKISANEYKLNVKLFNEGLELTGLGLSYTIKNASRSSRTFGAGYSWCNDASGPPGVSNGSASANPSISYTAVYYKDGSVVKSYGLSANGGSFFLSGQWTF